MKERGNGKKKNSIEKKIDEKKEKEKTDWKKRKQIENRMETANAGRIMGFKHAGP